MSRRRKLAVVGVILVVALGIGVVVVFSSERPEPETLAGAELIGGDGDVYPEDMGFPDEKVPLADVHRYEIGLSRRILAGPDDDFYATAGSRVWHVDSEGYVDDRGDVHDAEAFAVAADGQVAAVDYFGIVYRGASLDELRPLWGEESEGELWANLAFTADNDLLLARGAEPVIYRVRADGEKERLLGQPGDPRAEVQLDEPLGPIGGLVALSDDRVFFVADPGDGNQLYVLEDGHVDPFATDPPVALDGTGVRVPWAIEYLAPGPGDSLIAIGVGPVGWPVISWIDTTNGATKVLAELEGVDVLRDVGPADEHLFAVSAAAVGDDLIFLANQEIFLADQKIWKLEDAFA